MLLEESSLLFLHHFVLIQKSSNQIIQVQFVPLSTVFPYVSVLRLNQLQKVTVGQSNQLVHIIQLDLRDAGLQELDIMPLCRLELLRCDRNTLSILRVSGHALKSLHAAHNGTNVCCVLYRW